MDTDLRTENRMLRAALRDVGGHVEGEARDRVADVLHKADRMAAARPRSRQPRIKPESEPQPRMRYYRRVKPRWWQRNPLLRLLVEEVAESEAHDFAIEGGKYVAKLGRRPQETV